MKITLNKKQLLIIVIGLIAISVLGYVGMSGMFVGPQPDQGDVKVIAETVGGFKVTDQEIYKENGKPVVYFFGSNGCPHCKWEHPILLDVMQQFSDYISFHDNMDGQGDAEIYEKFKNQNQNAIPFLVAGGKYVKLGSGQSNGEEMEKKYLTAVMCKLIDSSSELCEDPEIASIVSQIP